MTTASGIYQPIMAIVNCARAFPASASEDGKLDIWQPRILYCLINGLGLLFAAYKVNSMGLLPTSVSDYASLFPSPVVKEVSMPSILL
ncbi:hypothetical protein WJX84_007143 [Apatococcus fuscideae]|uniref:ER membrane protein complex subunit 4 n=1 Tax=Apatococcus fuscideae TaxID=2026836 RepID=A0AAW1STJ4_9CHLO